LSETTIAGKANGWRELWEKEDWWSIWLGLGLVVAAYLLFVDGGSLKWIAVVPAKWSTLDQLTAHFAGAWLRYAAQFGLWLVLFTVGATALGLKPAQFVPAFVVLYIASVAIFALGAWDQASHYNLEPPLVALALGLLVSNFLPLPTWLGAGLRVEFYIKTGIVLLGATLPFTLIMWAGPIAFLQATIASVVTFLVIFFVARRLGLDQRLAATLGAGGAVCGVSAAIAIAGAVGAKKEDPPIAITTVIIWAIALIFLLPAAARLLHLPAGVAGAWIGTSEFADAAGFAAAQSYGGLAAAQVDGITGTADQAVWAYTLLKVVGRDVWIGIWAFVLAIVATTYWDSRESGRKPDAAQIWWRFPKFVLGFLAGSVFITVVASKYSLADYDKLVKPALVAPITAMRNWAFIFSFLSIGLTTRFRLLAHAGARPFIAFSIGAVINVVLGYVLSAVVFADHWQTLSR
jgi:uncharacterized membrane protein YadS